MTAAQAETLLRKHQCGVCRRDTLFAPCHECRASQPERVASGDICRDCAACPCLTCDRNRSVPRDAAAIRRARRVILAS